MSCWTLTSLQLQTDSALSRPSVSTRADGMTLTVEGFTQRLVSCSEAEEEEGRVGAAVGPPLLMLSVEVGRGTWYLMLDLLLASLWLMLVAAGVTAALVFWVCLVRQEKLSSTEKGVWCSSSKLSSSSSGLSICELSMMVVKVELVGSSSSQES